MTPPVATAPRRTRTGRIIALAALALAVVAAAALAVLGDNEEDAPSVREQYGGHGGAPAIKTGSALRLALDGRWRVATDPRATGQDRGYHRGRFGGRPVRLPHVPNAGRITGAGGVRSHEGSVAWYRTTLRVPETGRYALRFESVNHRAAIYLDGRRIVDHTGVYLPFEARPRLEAGRTHTLVVRADWRSPDAMKAEGWHRAWFNFGGINREVTIRPLGDAEVVSPAVRTTLRGRTARVEVTARVRNLGDEARKLDAKGTLRRGERETEVAFPAVEVAAGASREVRATVDLPGAKLWSPASPALYDLSIEAGDDEWRGRIGVREIRRRGTTLLLNGRPVKLRGASLHEDVPGRGDGLRPRDMDALIADLKRIGANATRVQHQLNPAFQERLDAAGILTWVGIGPVDAPGSWTSRGPRLVEQAHGRVRRTVAQMQTHPSIFAWNLANEVAGQGHPAGQADYIAEAARELKRRDPSRIVALDIWGSHPPREDGPMYQDIDAIGYTNYLGWYEGTFATKPELEQLIRTKLGALRDVFPDKIVAVTEFGAEGSTRNAQDSPGGLRFQANLLRTHIRTYASIPQLSGMLVWNLRDFAVAPSFGGGSIVEVVPDISILRGLNEKGLHRYDGRPKPSAYVVRDEYARIARR
jgi:hypothetical protein